MKIIHENSTVNYKQEKKRLKIKCAFLFIKISIVIVQKEEINLKKSKKKIYSFFQLSSSERLRDQ